MGHLSAGDYIFFYGKEMKIINWEQDFLYSTAQNNYGCRVCSWQDVTDVMSLLWMCMHQVRRKVTIQKTAFMRNYSRFSIMQCKWCFNSWQLQSDPHFIFSVIPLTFRTVRENVFHKHYYWPYIKNVVNKPHLTVTIPRAYPIDSSNISGIADVIAGHEI
jgi:hypothetical protein